jgi:SAM-dependent methyltransferase
MPIFESNFLVIMKKILLPFFKFINIFIDILPRKLKMNMFRIAFLVEGYSYNPRKDLLELLLIKDELEKIINNRALAFGKGEHPKHYLTGYHEFFIDNIIAGERVLDIGCGYGAVARNIALRYPSSKVVGIDNDKTRLNQARKSINPENLTFIYGDVTNNLMMGSWDVVVLSNVLEHIDDRINFLKLIASATNAHKILIRVPCFERDWQVPLRAELKINYYTDNDHKIEHKVQEFENEIFKSNLQITEITTKWAEIWAVCMPIDK